MRGIGHTNKSWRSTVRKSTPRAFAGHRNDLRRQYRTSRVNCLDDDEDEKKSLLREVPRPKLRRQGASGGRDASGNNGNEKTVAEAT